MLRITDEDLQFAVDVSVRYGHDLSVIRLCTVLVRSLIAECSTMAPMETLFTMAEQVDLDKIDVDLIDRGLVHFQTKKKIHLRMFFALCCWLDHEWREFQGTELSPNQCLAMVYRTWNEKKILSSPLFEVLAIYAYYC